MRKAHVAGVASAALIAAALWSVPVAFAAPSLSSPEMKVALAKAQESTTALRRYVQRTKPIYALDYFEVKAIADAQKVAVRVDPPVIARARSE